ncbi:uncharacterized protein MELLADRAFT_72658 [Melampsora larici-populina 98AG31]|uniref:Uncharacterized protein n=1 Tax=Melampsora larici-populina (strain 98AG31 / pathotype 3-4-7) TaxID=747676 RepID=F4RX88_MELLP|nr:uncharacterized protein MELLADRAFT_72658 [Melampsora larici-populina 98AG31]EGG03030.1 hypothetical protein MELLADRAFT_72658 [Melampsora larici-populina 98AG31]
MSTNVDSYQTEPWTHLREYVYTQTHFPNTKWFPATIVCLMLAHVITMVVHVVGGVKSSRGKERSLFLRDSQGYYHPNHHIAMPSTVMLYAVASCLAMGSFLYDYLSKAVHAQSILFYSLGVSLGLMVHWQQIVLVAYALPPSKFRFLQRASWKAGLHSPRRHILSSSHFNLLFGIGTLLPFILPAVPVFLSFNCVRATLLKGKILDDLCVELIGLLELTSTSADNEILASEKRMAALSQLAGLSKSPEEIWGYYKWTAGMYCIVVCSQSVAAIWVHIAILRRLFAQVKIVKDCWIQRQRLRSESKFTGVNVTYPPDDQQDAHVGIIKMKNTGASNNLKASNSEFVNNWTDWLPSYKSPPNISQEEWKSDLLDTNKKNWATKEKSLMKEQYIILRAYATNYLWITILIFIIELTSLLFTLSILLNWYGVPYRLSPIQASTWIVVWANSIWGLAHNLRLISL